jgi:hypothetical protein
MGQMYVSTFSGQASAEVAQEVLGDLLNDLLLWTELKTAEDAALHNAALRILKKMRAGPSLGLKSLDKITLLIEHERPEDAT